MEYPTLFKHYVDKIDTVDFYDPVVKTPLHKLTALSRRSSNNILLKREDMQPIFSFKIRGAYYKMHRFSEANKQRGVITASAGNHGQGVTLSASRLGIESTIVMPLTSPQIKVDAVSALGGKILLWGNSYDEAFEQMRNIEQEKKLIYIPPFDDQDIIIGQGTIAKEILSQCRSKIDSIYVPVGGGGLCSGIAAYIKWVKPEIKVYGVEPEDSACLKASLAAGKRVVIPQPGLFADGVATTQVGRLNFEILKSAIDGVITVTKDEICAAIKDIFEDTRSIAEPSGALALAGLKKHQASSSIEGKILIAINSGANVNFNALPHITERADIGDNKEVLLGIILPEKIGTLRRLWLSLGSRKITELSYRYSHPDKAILYLGIKVDSLQDKSELIKKLHENDFQVIDFTDNETSKLHIRYMAGGRVNILDEHFFRARFPERPRALADLLGRFGSRWNISLFHYRNHLSAEGQVLVGLLVPSFELQEVGQLLEGYCDFWEEEVDNSAIDLFLRDSVSDS